MTPIEAYLAVLSISVIVTSVILYYAHGIISYARLPDTDLKEEDF